MIAGLSNVGSLDAGVNLLLILERTLHAVLPHAASFEELYGAFLSRTRDTVEQIKREINRSRKERAPYNPLPMRTLLVDDCIDRGVEYQAGGARYNWSILNFAGLINVIDSLLAVKYWVFDQKTVTAEELLSRLRLLHDDLVESAVRQLLSGITEGANAGQKNFVSRANDLGVGGHDAFRTDGIKR